MCIVILSGILIETSLLSIDEQSIVVWCLAECEHGSEELRSTHALSSKDPWETVQLPVSLAAT